MDIKRCGNVKEYTLDLQRDLQICMQEIKSLHQLEIRHSFKFEGCYNEDKLEQLREVGVALQALNLRTEKEETTIYVNFPETAFVDTTNKLSKKNNFNADCSYWKLFRDYNETTGYRMDDVKHGNV